MGRKKFSKRLIYIIISLLVVSVLIFKYVYNRSIDRPIKTQNDSIIVKVNEGEGFYDILDHMNKNGNIRNKFMIKLRMSINKTNVSLKPGLYEVNKNSTLDDLINILEGKYSDKSLVTLTIPEGYTIEEIAQKISKNNIATKDEFLKAVKEYDDLPYFVTKKKNVRYQLEGYLYPDTYYIQKDSDCNKIIKMMLDRFEVVLQEVKNENNLNLSNKEIADIITKASVIEKEAKTDNDRVLISSVINNRIRKDMKLQIDATVIYALNEKVEVVLYRHLKKDSPYNTYIYKGLPVGPICCPGKESITAAINPKDTNYLYYVLKKDGSHYFTSSYKDFEKKKKQLGY